MFGIMRFWIRLAGLPAPSRLPGAGAAASALILALASPGLSGQCGNLVANGDFEDTQNDPWTVSTAAAGYYRRFAVNGRVASRYLAVSANTAWTAQQPTPFSLRAGTPYEFAADVYSSATANTFEIRAVDSRGNRVVVASMFLPGAGDYARAIGVFYPPSSQSYTIEIASDSSTNVDNVSVRQNQAIVRFTSPRAVNTSNTLEVLARPGERFIVFLGSGIPSSPIQIPGCSGALDLREPVFPVFGGTTNASGRAGTSLHVPPFVEGLRVDLQAALSTPCRIGCRESETFPVRPDWIIEQFGRSQLAGYSFSLADMSSDGESFLLRTSRQGTGDGARLRTDGSIVFLGGSPPGPLGPNTPSTFSANGTVALLDDFKIAYRWRVGGSLTPFSSADPLWDNRAYAVALSGDGSTALIRARFRKPMSLATQDLTVLWSNGSVNVLPPVFPNSRTISEDPNDITCCASGTVVVGSSFSSQTGTGHGWIWRGGNYSVIGDVIPYRVSDNGLYCVAFKGLTYGVWNSAAGFRPLTPPTGYTIRQLDSLSADGSTVVGQLEETSTKQRWTGVWTGAGWNTVTVLGLPGASASAAKVDASGRKVAVTLAGRLYRWTKR